MENLVADLLFIARVDEGAPVVNMAPVDLHEIVLEEVARPARTTAVQIHSREIDSAFVVGRRSELSRAIQNVLDNAVRHADAAVAVEVRTDLGTVTVSIEDDGPGVPVEDRDRVFARFTRLDGARSRATGGAGLGLAIVNEIVERHGGTVSVSTGRTGGARFEIRLPADGLTMGQLLRRSASEEI